MRKSRDTTTNTAVLNGLAVTSTFYPLPSALNNGDAYQWYVRAYDSFGDVALAPQPLTFNVAISIPPPVLGNLSGTVNTATPTFQWSAVPGAAGYRLYVDDVTANSLVVNGLLVADTSYTLGTPLIFGHQYRWWVTAFDSNQDVSVAPPSLLFQVYQPATLPPVPMPTGPSGTVGTLTPTFQWSNVGAASYEFDVVDLSISSLPLVIPPTPVAGTSAVSPVALTNGHSYDVQVQAFDNAGNASGWSTGLTFVVNTPAGPVADLIGEENGAWWLGVSNGSNAFLPANGAVSFGSTAANTAAAQWVDVQVGDFDGTRSGELAGRVAQTGQWWVAVPNGAGGFTTTPWGIPWAPINWQHVLVGDFNGDGKTDLAALEPGTGHWWVALANGNGFATTLWASWASLNWLHVFAGDFSGDGKIDLAAMEPDNGTWWVGRSTGSAFATSAWGRWTPDYSGLTWDVVIGDFNGDGQADIAGFLEQGGQWWVAASTGTSFVTSPWVQWTPDSAAPSWQDWRVGDFLGNGRDQIAGLLVGTTSGTGQWWVFAANAARTGFTPQWWTTWTDIPGVVDWGNVVVGDFNGDGKADIAGWYEETGQWWVNLSSGSAFNVGNTYWTTWSHSVTWVNVHGGLFV